MKELEAIIGLEVHAQMNTKTKMFCGCDNDAFGKEPNTTVCPICMGHPGTLPAPNGNAIEKAVNASLAIGGDIQLDNHFDRKHYFYPDLPFGYQISQYDYPLSKGGSVEFNLFDTSGNSSGKKKCRITRLHIENDAGKLMHSGKKSLVDYNRAGTPLMEIVTEPDLRSPEEASAFAQELRRILIAVNASDADMFKGMMRFDASVSLREKGSEKLNPRSEIKNLNSFKSLEMALSYEIDRLKKLWDETGGPLKGDITVGWMETDNFKMTRTIIGESKTIRGQTKMLRDKESAQDYRYFPEPDIPPLHFTREDIEKLRSELPLLPHQMKEHYLGLGLDESKISQLIDDTHLRNVFDAIYTKTKDAKRASSIALTQLPGALNAHGKSVSESPSAEAILTLLEKIDDGTISANTGKEVLDTMVASGKSAVDIIKSAGMQNISDESAIETLVEQAIAANPKAIESFKAGKEAALGAIVGWVMKESKGNADPAKVNGILRNKLQ